MLYHIKDNRLGRNHRFIMRLGDNIAGVAVEHNVEVFTDFHVRSRHISTMTREEVEDVFNNMDVGTVWVKKRITDKAELNWLINGAGHDIGWLLQRHFRQSSNLSYDSVSRLFEHIAKRVNPEPVTDRWVYYHRNTFNLKPESWDLTRYKQAKEENAELAKLVRHTLNTDDSSELCDFFLEHEDNISHSTFRNIANMLDYKAISFDVRITDCDHFELDDEIRHLGRRGDTSVCRACFENEVEHCENGDYYDYRDNLYEHNDGYYYSYEEEDDDDYDGDSDSNEEHPDQLMSYSTNVLNILEPDHSIISSIHGDFRMGVELEFVGRGYSYNEINASVADVRNQLGESYCVCKSDGSLPQGGIEIVTAPRGLAEHIKRFKAWDIHSSYRAWDTGRCGMHIHIHTKAFTALTLGKFIMLVNAETNADFIRKIAGRHPLRDTQARDYCASESQDILDNPNTALKGKASSRYRMVNCENMTRSERNRLGLQCEIHKPYDTVELRIFKASLKKERLLAQIEFTHALVMFCRVASWKDLTGESFKKWLKTTRNAYPHLADWYGIRRRAGAKNSAPTEGTCTDVTTTASSI